MAQPTAGDVHVNRPLTNVSVAHWQSSTAFVANRAGLSIPVEKQTDSIFRFKKGAFHRNDMKIRAPGAESAGGGFDTVLAGIDWTLGAELEKLALELRQLQEATQVAIALPAELAFIQLVVIPDHIAGHHVDAGCLHLLQLVRPA